MGFIVVLDTNIWIAEQMLRDSSGAAFRFYLHTHGAQLAVPEVVRREVIVNHARGMKDLSRGMQKAHKQLLLLTGSLKELVLPSDDELEAEAERVFKKCGLNILDVEFSLESARASLEKCIKGEPPSGPKDQQFKDGVLWADCIRLAENAPVILVTSDKAFYHGREYNNGLALNLKYEADATLHGVTVFPKLESVLERVRENIVVDYDALAAAFAPVISEQAERLVGAQGFVIGERDGGTHKLFATHEPSVAHLEFQLVYRCRHPDGREGTLTVPGEGQYIPLNGAFRGLRGRGEQFDFEDTEGTTQRRNVLLLAGSIFSGHRTVSHEMRAPLN